MTRSGGVPPKEFPRLTVTGVEPQGPAPKPEINMCKEKSGPLKSMVASRELGAGAQLIDTLPPVRANASALAVRVPQTQTAATAIVNKTTLHPARRAQASIVLRDIIPPDKRHYTRGGSRSQSTGRVGGARPNSAGDTAFWRRPENTLHPVTKSTAI